MPNLPVIIYVIGAVVLALLLIGALFVKNYVKVPPNQVAVFTGRGAIKTVRGGARFRVPGIERVDYMELTPFNVEVSIERVLSSDSVPVNVKAVGLIRFGSTEDMLETAVQRFLTSDRQTLLSQVTEITAGALRNIVSQMTVEELNSNRDELTNRVLEEAEARFQPIGMQLDVLTIQGLSDENGYLEALGRKRTADVKAQAVIGEAEAKRDSDIKSAQARQQGEVAQAAANQAIADATRELQLRQAAIRQEVDAAQSRALQAGPLAEAQARRAVELANVETEQQRTQAQIAVEQQRAAKAEQAQQADVVIPAEAARQAAILRAEGERDAAISAAQADARKRELEGEADANARTKQAEAKQAELTAEAEGEKAKLFAQAEGQQKMAEALKAYSAEAARLNVVPQLIAMLPQLAEKLAAPMGNIDKVVLVDGGGSGAGGNALTRFAGSTTAALPQLIEMLGAVGIDLSAMLGQSGSSSSNLSSANGHASVPAVTTIPVDTDDEPSSAIPAAR